MTGMEIPINYWNRDATFAPESEDGSDEETRDPEPQASPSIIVIASEASLGFSSCSS